MALPLSVSLSDATQVGDLGRVGGLSNSSGRSYTFQVGKGNSARTSANSGQAEAADSLVGKYAPWAIVGAAVIAAWFIVAVKKERK